MKSWTAQEDQLLKQLYNKAPNFRKWKWVTNSLAQKGIIKSQYQCRERFINKLDPTIIQQNWTVDQIKKIFKIYDEYGSEWCSIQKFLVGRTQNAIKNKFYSVLRNAVRSLAKSAILLLYSIQLTYHDPSSALLIDLYQGKKKFLKVKGLIQQCLKFLNYRIDKEKLSMFIEKNIKKIEIFLDLMIFDKIEKPPRNQICSYTELYSTKDKNLTKSENNHQSVPQSLIKQSNNLVQDLQKYEKIFIGTQEQQPKQLIQTSFPPFLIPQSEYMTGINYNLEMLSQINQSNNISGQAQYPIFLLWCSATQINSIFQNMFS